MPQQNQLVSGQRRSASGQHRFTPGRSGSAAWSGEPASTDPVAWLTGQGLAFLMSGEIVVPIEVIARLPRRVPPTPTVDVSTDNGLARHAPGAPGAPHAPLGDLGVILAAARQGHLVRDGRGLALNASSLDWLVPRCRPSLGAAGVPFLTDLALAAGLLTRSGRFYDIGPTVEHRLADDVDGVGGVDGTGAMVVDAVGVSAPAGVLGPGHALWRAWLDAPPGGAAAAKRVSCAKCEHLRTALARRLADRLATHPSDTSGGRNDRASMVTAMMTLRHLPKPSF